MFPSYTKSVTCAICGIRKPRRFCPSVGGDICTLCCATGREETIDCPRGCEYLQDAHLHERPNDIDPDAVPNADVELPDSFLEANEPLLMLLSSAVVAAAGQRAGITDYDVREAFEALLRAYRAQQSGLHYDALPVNPYAAAVFEAVEARVAEIRKREVEARGKSALRPESVSGLIVFLQRLEYLHNNGRKRSRAFLDFLARFFEAVDSEQAEIDVEAEAPRIIL